MVEWSCTKKEEMRERRSYIFVEWSCANEGYLSMKPLIFGRMVVYQRNKNERGLYNFVEWSCANKKINQCGP